MAHSGRKRSPLRGLFSFGGLGLLIAIGAMFFAFGGMDMIPGLGGGATITSQNEECASDVRNALEVFRDEGGMRFDVKPTDPRELFSEGNITKRYRRDGMRQDVSFRPHVSDGECRLRFYRRVQRRPGERSSSRGNYGEVALPSCTCE